MQQDPYNKWVGKLKPDYSRMRARPQQDAAAQKASDDKMWWANASPWMGSALGGIAGGALGAIGGGLAGLPAGGVGAIPGAITGGISGAGLGAGVGNQIGTGIGAGFKADAERQLDPQRERAMREEALMMALQGWG